MNGLAVEGVIDNADKIMAVEARLQAGLFPIQPRAEFVAELKQRLLQVNELELEKARPSLVQTIFLPAAGLLSGVVLIALGVRGLIALINSFGGLQSLKNGIAQKKTAPAQPAA
jgi:hypothetical protein